MPACTVDLDTMEADLGAGTVDRVLDQFGGRRIGIPSPTRASTSLIASHLGVDAATWLAARYGGEQVAFPSRQARIAAQRASLLRADVIEAGLIAPSRSANDIASAHGVTTRRVQQIRQQLRRERQPAKSHPDTAV